MVKGKLLSYGDNFSNAYNIRREVFINELKYEEKDVFDDKDSIAMHVLVEADNKYVATGRITYINGICEISKIAVLKDYRHKKYGDVVLRMLVNRGILANVDKISLYCDKNIISFFKNVGFIVLNNNISDSMCSMCLTKENFKSHCGDCCC